MAIIKCEYTKSYCNYYGCYDQKEVFHNRNWWCDSNDECPYHGYTKPFKNNENLVNPTCHFCSDKLIRFEKSYKQFELHMMPNRFFNEGYLKIGKTEIDLYNVNFLEIDGKVYINEEDK